MPRKTYVLRDGKLVEKSKAPPLQAGPFVMPDIAEFRTLDGTVIGGRRDLRAYEQRTGLRQVGNDWAPHLRLPNAHAQRRLLGPMKRAPALTRIKALAALSGVQSQSAIEEGHNGNPKRTTSDDQDGMAARR